MVVHEKEHRAMKEIRSLPNDEFTSIHIDERKHTQNLLFIFARRMASTVYKIAKVNKVRT